MRRKEKPRDFKHYESDSDLDEDFDAAPEPDGTAPGTQKPSATPCDAWEGANASSRLVVRVGAYRT